MSKNVVMVIINFQVDLEDKCQSITRTSLYHGIIISAQL